ncbi:energy-coupling factor ABC transporter permease [Methanoregula sp.]|uniref:energy-coupling factor ABC transporter permease n=1 Tax=Methanoregula sp. TaxID=2052170 RepID=UPI003569BEB6
MAHIHLEDGSFSLLWVIVWWASALLLLGIALYFLRTSKKPDPRRITIAAFCTAAAFAVFQVDIPIAGGVHINLTPLIGILTGPIIGSLIVFISNILSAAIGHGGWGMIGANTLVNFSEVVVAYGVFRLLKRWIPDLFSRAGIATIIGLFVGNCVMIGIILVSGIQGVTQGTSQMLPGLSLIFAINMGVAVIEAFVTGLVVAYMGRVRPDLLDGEKK